MSIHLDVCPPTCSLTLILLLFKLNCFINLIHSWYLCTFMVPAMKPTDKPIYNNFSAYCEILNFVLDSNHQWTMCKIWWWSGIELKQIRNFTLRFNEVERGVYWFHLVRLSVCGQNRVRSVSSTILVRSISYWHILSSNFRRCVACNVCFKIKKFQILANS